MNNPSGMSQAEMLALMGVMSPTGADRSERRALERRMNRPVKSSATLKGRKIDREARRKKRRASRRDRAKNRR